MLNDFINMISQADLLNGYKREDSKILFNGEHVEVVIITVETNDYGDSVEAIFHKGTETLIDMNVKHKCSCACDKGVHHHV